MIRPSDFLLPWEDSVKVALLGLHAPTNQFWSRSAHLTKARDHYAETGLESWRAELILEGRKILAEKGKLKSLLNINWWPAFSYDQTLWLFRNIYQVDFIETPTFGLYKAYRCDTLGRGELKMELSPRDTPQNARLQAIQELLKVVKPLEIVEEKKPWKDEDEEGYDLVYSVPEFDSIINNLFQTKCQEQV